MVWFEFITAAALVILAGRILTKQGDKLSDLTGLESSWIGVIFLGAATSLPELVSTISSVVMENAPNMALGNVYGSNVFNLLIIFLMDLFYKEGTVLAHARRNHILTASLGAVLSAVSMLAIAAYTFSSLIGLRSDGSGIIEEKSVIFGMDWASLVVFGGYFISMYLIYQHEHGDDCVNNDCCDNEAEVPNENSDLNTEKLASDIEIAGKRKKEILHVSMAFGLGILIVIASGMWLVSSASRIAELPFPGTDKVLGHTFAGTVLLAIATSLPEASVSIAAVLIGRIDMALGNVLGSNIFNLVLIPIADFFGDTPVLANPNAIGQSVAGMTSLIMTGIVISGIALGGKRVSPRIPMGWATLSILIVWIAGAIVFFKLGLGVN